MLISLSSLVDDLPPTNNICTLVMSLAKMSRYACTDAVWSDQCAGIADSMVVPGADLTADGGTRPVGKVIAVSGDTALVLVRLKAALQAAGGQSSLFVSGSTANILPRCPSWWPEQWRSEAAELSSART